MARSTSYSTDLAECGEQHSRRTGRCEGWAVRDNARPAGKGTNSIFSLSASVYLSLHYDDGNVVGSARDLSKAIFVSIILNLSR